MSAMKVLLGVSFVVMASPTAVFAQGYQPYNPPPMPQNTYQGYNASPPTYVTPTIRAYTPPPQPAPLGTGQGTRGYDGTTGQVDRTYVPADSNPNPPPNVGYGQ